MQPAAGGSVGDDIYYAGAIVQIAKSAIVGFTQAACAVGGLLCLVC